MSTARVFTSRQLFHSEHSESRVEMAAKLETVAHDNIVLNLGKLAENIDGNFCCGGMLNSPNCVCFHMRSHPTLASETFVKLTPKHLLRSRCVNVCLEVTTRCSIEVNRACKARTEGEV